MKVLVINNAELEDRNFFQPIVKIIESINTIDGMKIDTNIIHWTSITSINDNNIDEYDCIIASGSSQGDDPMPTHGPLYETNLNLLNSKTPFFGICTGFHLQAWLRNQPLIHMDRSETGYVDIDIIKDDPIFNGIGKKGDNFKAIQMHNDSINLPTSFELLASTPRCEIQLIKSKELPVFYCSQFHPEQPPPNSSVDSTKNHQFSPASQLLKNFIYLVRDHNMRKNK